MTERLPTHNETGWDTIIEGYLDVEHNTDGTHKFGGTPSGTKFLRDDRQWAYPPTGGGGSGQPMMALFAVPDGLAVSAGRTRIRFPADAVITDVTMAVDTAPTGASIIVDLNKNGTTMFTTQANRPVIAASANATSTPAVPDVTTVASGDYLTVDVDQVGSTVQGSNLTVIVRYTWSVATDNRIAVVAYPGGLVTQTGTARLLFPAAATIVDVTMAVDTAPTGASIICDVNKNGTTIFTTQANRPTIAAAGHATTVAASPDITAFAAADYLTVDIDQVGSMILGADLSVIIRYAFT